MVVPTPSMLSTSRVAPMLAATGDLPEDADRWCLELKWDGVRVVCHVTPHGVRAAGRRGADVTGRYPELSGLVDLVPGREAVLDGEVVDESHLHGIIVQLQALGVTVVSAHPIPQ